MQDTALFRYHTGSTRRKSSEQSENQPVPAAQKYKTLTIRIIAADAGVRAGNKL